MLYIASALTPTPISFTVEVTGLTGAATKSLIVAKPDHIEVWDVTAAGLVSRGQLDVWGTVVGLSTTYVPNARPHVLVLVGPPNARLLLVTWENGLVVTASQALSPPTPLLRPQEFFTGVIAQTTTALVSLWTGLLACVELELEKVKDAKRRASVKDKDDMEVDGEGRRLVFKNSMNIHIREHNLLSLAFAPPREGENPVLMFLWMSETNKIQLQPRQLLISQQRCDDQAHVTDVVNPLDYPVEGDMDIDFNDIPFSCPAGRQVLAIPEPGPRGARLFLVVGDEHSVLYSVRLAAQDTRASADAPRRSPQQDIGGVGKRRKSNISGRGVTTDNEERWCVQPVWRVRQGWGTVLAATVLESHGTGGSVLLGDECGRLTAIGWEFDQGDQVTVSKVDIGVASAPTALTYLDNGVVFISSACGDSILARLSVGASSPKMSGSIIPRSNKGKGRAQENTDGGAWTIMLNDDESGRLDVMERWMNIAPVKDFVAVEGEDKQSHIVVASGSANTNSLRIVRSGVGLETLVTVNGVVGVQQMWSLDASGGPNALLLSTCTSSFILGLDSDIEVIPTSSDFSSHSTLAAGQVGPDNALVQVTRLGINVWRDMSANSAVDVFKAADDNDIVAARVKGSNIVAAFQDGGVMVFSVSSSGLQETFQGRLSRELAAVDISDFGTEILIAIGDWNGDIRLYTGSDLASGTPFAETREAAYASALLFQDTPGGGLRLLAGLSDGNLVTYDVDASAQCLAANRISSSLGSLPLRLASVHLPSDLFEEPVTGIGISDRLNVLFESRNHLESSASGKAHVNAAVSVSISTLGPCVAIATANGLTFERLTSLRKVQVSTLDLGDSSAIRLDFVPGRDVLAAGMIRRTLDPETGDIFQSSYVEIRHPTTLALLATYQLPPREAVTSVRAVRFGQIDYIAVGTAVFSTDEDLDESSLDEISTFVPVDKGRLIILEPFQKVVQKQNQWALDEIVTLDTTAAVYDAIVVDGYLAVASATKVSILRFSRKPRSLTEVSQVNNAFEARFLAVAPREEDDPSSLVIGDGMRSIIVVDINPSDGSVKNTSRDMAAHSVRSMGVISHSARTVQVEIIISDGNANLQTFYHEAGVTPHATFGLHESVARIRNGSLVPQSAPDTLQGDLMFATANGRFGVIGTLGKSATRTLQDLQRNLSKAVKGPGNLEWKVFRRGGTSVVPKDTAGFIDGDFVQRFLNLDNTEANDVLHGTGLHEVVHKLQGDSLEEAPREHVVRVLEAAAGLH